MISVIGTVYAAKAKGEGQKASGKFFVIGIIEIIVYSLGVIFMILAVLITFIAANR